jgi:hypothetical protein
MTVRQQDLQETNLPYCFLAGPSLQRTLRSFGQTILKKSFQALNFTKTVTFDVAYPRQGTLIHNPYFAE